MQRVKVKGYPNTFVVLENNHCISLQQGELCEEVGYSPADALELASALVGAAMEAARREVEATECGK
jgi:hypothetical protein